MGLHTILKDFTGVIKVFIADFNEDLNIYWRWNPKRIKMLLFLSFSAAVIFGASQVAMYFNIGMFG